MPRWIICWICSVICESCSIWTIGTNFNIVYPTGWYKLGASGRIWFLNFLPTTHIYKHGIINILILSILRYYTIYRALRVITGCCPCTDAHFIIPVLSIRYSYLFGSIIIADSWFTSHENIWGRCVVGFSKLKLCNCAKWLICQDISSKLSLS